MDFTKAFATAGFVATKPLKEKVRKKRLSELDCEIPAEIEAFYEQCDGGSVEELSCRAYPLAQAVGLVGMYDFHAGFRFLPFFVAQENESDPVMVGLEPPLSGYVFQLCHDLRSRMLAPSISSFLRSLPSQPEDEFFCIEESTFVYPKALSESEQETVEGLIARSMTELEVEYEPQLLVELALSMLTDEACIDLLRDLDHPDHNARHEIADRLKQIGTPAAEQILGKAEDELKAFVGQAIEVLKEHGFDATTTSGTDLRVRETKEMGLNVPAFFDRRNDADCWEYLVERVRYLSDRRDERPGTEEPADAIAALEKYPLPDQLADTVAETRLGPPDDTATDEQLDAIQWWAMFITPLLAHPVLRSTVRALMESERLVMQGVDIEEAIDRGAEHPDLTEDEPLFPPEEEPE